MATTTSFHLPRQGEHDITLYKLGHSLLLFCLSSPGESLVHLSFYSHFLSVIWYLSNLHFLTAVSIIPRNRALHLSASASHRTRIHSEPFPISNLIVMFSVGKGFLHGKVYPSVLRPHTRSTLGSMQYNSLCLANEICKVKIT